MIVRLHKHIQKHIKQCHRYCLGGLGIVGLFFLIFSWVSIIMRTFANVNITPATNGTNICTNKAANGSNPTRTPLSNIVITELAMDDFAIQTNTTLILTAPNNWHFKAGSGTSSAIGGNVTINSTTVTSTGIIINLSANKINRIDTVTISDISVQAVDGAILPSSGNILRTSSNPGTATIAGIILNTTNFGSLSQADITAPIITGIVFTPDFSGTTVKIYIQERIIDQSGVSGDVITTVSGNLFRESFPLTRISGTEKDGIREATYTFPSSDIAPDGGYRFRSAASDIFANSGDLFIGAIGFDRSGPQMKYMVPSAVYVGLSGGFTLTVSGYDVGLGFSEVNFMDLTSGVSGTMITGTILPTGPMEMGTWTFALVITGAYGSHIVQAEGVDLSGHSSIMTGRITYDYIVPIISGVENNASYKSLTPIIIEEFLDTIKLNDMKYISGTEIIIEGPYDLVATDLAGNSTAVHFIIDATAPTIAFTDNTEEGPVSSDTITPDWGSSDIKLRKYHNTYTCPPLSGEYDKTDADTMNQTNSTNNGKYICMYAADTVGNYVTLASDYPINITVSGGGGGGGGGSHYVAPTTGTTAGAVDSSGTIDTGKTFHGIANIMLNIDKSPYPMERNVAYLYAYEMGITTIPTIQQAHMEDVLIRSHMAKMMVNYAINVLDKKVTNSGALCEFDDIADQPGELQAYIRIACKLGFMGIGITSFNPNGEVTRAQFGTVLSRILYGNIYDVEMPWYLNHLNALKTNNIITNTNPDLKELRGYVMLMLMRAAAK